MKIADHEHYTAPDASHTDLPGLAARRIAADILDKCSAPHRPLEGSSTARSSISASPRSPTATARWRASSWRPCCAGRQLAASAAKFLDSDFPKDAPRVETVLLIGAAQILFLEVPDHAAVDLACASAGDRRAANYPGLVNAVLRRATREGPELIKCRHRALDTPPWLFARWSPSTARTLRARLR